MVSAASADSASFYIYFTYQLRSCLEASTWSPIINMCWNTVHFTRRPIFIIRLVAQASKHLTYVYFKHVEFFQTFFAIEKRNFCEKFLISPNNNLSKIYMIITRRTNLCFRLSGSSTSQILFSQFKFIPEDTQKQNKQTNNYFYIIINQVNTHIDQYNPTGLVLRHLHRFIDAAALQPSILLLTSWYPLLLSIRIPLLIQK